MKSPPPEVVVPSSTTDSILAPNPIFVSCDDAAAFLHESLKDQRGTEFSGFILKNEEGHFFCAAEVMYTDERVDAQKKPNFPLVVSVSANGELEVPNGYIIEARLLSHTDKVRGPEESNVEWIQRKLFFSVPDLFEVMTRRRKFSRCYLSGSDGGLISYTSKDSEFEEELSRQLGRKPDGRLQSFESSYERDAVPGSILILLAVAAGEVATVVPGNLWRVRGELKASWRKDILQQNPPIRLMPVCGPILKNASEVARYLHTKMQKLSTAQQQVGIVLKHKTQEVFVVTLPVASDYATFNREVLFPKDRHGNPMLPETFRVHGFYHSMSPAPANRLPPTDVELYKNFFSPTDLRVGLGRVAVAPHHRLFLCTLDGAVLRFAKPESEKVTELRTKLDLYTDGQQDVEQKLMKGDMSPRAFVDWVAAAGGLGVLHTSKVWPRAGKVAVSTTVVAVDPEATQ
ncbi:hypothetical protein [Pseudomonas fluorescens]|uniref:DUF4329 domain-containing protein n=1 Tax=Pseudomonas fluorescens TaxID=294 RepID=A0A0F4SZG3_PSEFL|nr:hypothetical protein [Pseudomonas fluorescens]KJZ37165.1 hypothetical protein VC34_26060 [Pseudomonas fluorescens]